MSRGHFQLHSLHPMDFHRHFLFHLVLETGTEGIADSDAVSDRKVVKILKLNLVIK